MMGDISDLLVAWRCKCANAELVWYHLCSGAGGCLEARKKPLWIRWDSLHYSFFCPQTSHFASKSSVLTVSTNQTEAIQGKASAQPVILGVYIQSQMAELLEDKISSCLAHFFFCHNKYWLWFGISWNGQRKFLPNFQIDSAKIVSFVVKDWKFRKTDFNENTWLNCPRWWKGIILMSSMHKRTLKLQ